MSLIASPGWAQGLSAEPLVPSTDPARALHLLRVTLGPRAEDWQGELAVETREYTAQGSTTRVLRSARVPRGEARVLLLPALYGDDGTVVVRAEGRGSASVDTLPGSRRGGRVLRLALAGLGERVGAELRAAPAGGTLATGVLAWDGEATGPWPSAPSFWGGTDVVLAAGEALAEAPPDARSALDDWLRAGGVLALSPRNQTDLRDPWVLGHAGALESSAQGLAGAGARCSSWGCTARVGLGALVVLPMDLSQRAGTDEQTSRERLQAFLGGVRAGGMLAPGDLGLYTELRDRYGALRPAFFPRVPVRRQLVPVSVLLGVYIILVGVLFRVWRASPLKVFARVPLLGLLGLGLVGVSARVSRGDRDSARVVALYDVADGEPRAFRRVLAGLTAGRSRTFALVPPAGSVAVFRGGGDTASGVLRWDGARVSVERARLGVWETGLLYLEGMTDLGGAVSIEQQQGTIRVRNGTRLNLTAMVFLEAVTGRATRLPGAPPGAVVEAPRAAPGPPGAPSLSALRMLERPGRDDLAASVLEYGLHGGPHPFESAEGGVLWALAALPQDVPALLAPFGLERGQALLRVVSVDRARAFPAGRLTTQRSSYEVPVATEPPDGAVGDASRDTPGDAPGDGPGGGP